MENNARILLVDDRKENLDALKALLETPGLEIMTAASGNEALGLILEHEFAVVLLDVQMPDMDGFEVAELMRSKEKTRYIPIIFVTAISKEKKYIFKGYESGAVDYLFKPLDPVVLKSKVNIFLDLDRQKKELEESNRQVAVRNKRLKEIAIRDGLTGLYNQRYFQEVITREFALVRRSHTDVSCFMLDLDFFKDVNDTFGHGFGDYVLRHFAALARGVIRQTDIFARCGGEEFVLLLPHTSLDGARFLAEKLRRKAEAHLYQQDGYSRQVTVSIGISSYLFHQPRNPTELITFADKALYRAKTGGRNQVRIYLEEEMIKEGSIKKHSPEMLPTLRERLATILENTKESILASFETLVQHPENNFSVKNSPNFKLIREHNRRMLETLDRMGERLGLSRYLVHTFKRTTLIHNLFKTLMGDETAGKDGPPRKHKQEQGNREDYPFMMEEVARTFDIFAEERVILRYRHENYNGLGYPGGLKGSAVPLGARLFALADAFAAMTSNSDCPTALSPEEVINELVKQAGQQFDPVLVHHLLDIIEEKKLLPVSKQRIREAKKEIQQFNNNEQKKA